VGSQILYNNVNILTPVGSITAYLGPIADDNGGCPPGWLFCNGKGYLVEGIYNNLFKLIGYSYGPSGNYIYQGQIIIIYYDGDGNVSYYTDANNNVIQVTNPEYITTDRFCVPDFRGTFLRGASNMQNSYFSDTYGQYGGPNLKEFQEPIVGSHTHTFQDKYISVIDENSSDTYPAVSTDVYTAVLQSVPSTTGVNTAQTDDNDPNTTYNVNSRNNCPFNVGVNWIIKY